MSLKGDKYETLDEIKFRLENTIVLYEGRPVYITRVQYPDGEDEIARVYFQELPYGVLLNKHKEHRKYLSSKKFDLTPFKMGYFNHGGEAIFTARTPVRQNKQGLSQATTSLLDIKGQRHGRMNFAIMVGSDGFADMVNGVFPEFKQVVDMIGGPDTSSAAVSRSFAFYIDHDLEALYLINKGTKCGLALKGDRALKIPPKFHFLRQELEAHHLPIA